MITYIWFCFVSWLVVRTYGFDPIEFASQRRELARAHLEVDKLRVAFCRAKELIRKQREEATTMPSMHAAGQSFPAAEEVEE